VIIVRVTKNNDNPINEQKIIDTIRMLGIDMIDNAKSGHPGIVLDAAPIIYTIYAHHLKFDPSNPNFYNRDRFILSAGHASSLLYATLFMAGFDIELDDLKSFRQLDSLTPGHPEYNKTPGIIEHKVSIHYGDSDDDILAAKEAGIRGIRLMRAANSTYQPMPTLGGYGEEVLINSNY
jgi:transketolase N-terminal domain/subunit